MSPLGSFATNLNHLVNDTVRTWWRTLPRVLTAVLAGWAVSHALTQSAALAVELSPWLSLGLMALAFVAILSSVVIALRILGEELQIRQAVPLAEDDPRDRSVSHLLAVTLLPFLGIYAAFDKVTEAAARLQTDYFVFYGLSFENPLLDQFNPAAEGNAVWVIGSIIVTLYLVRRGLDFWFDRSGFRPLGLVSALVEGFFMFLLVLSGRQAAIIVRNWVDARVFRQWLDYPGWGLHWVFARFGVDISDALKAFGDFTRDVLLPGLSQALVAPLLWLAVTALVYGTQVLSVADLWRKGESARAVTRGGRGIGVGDRGRAATLHLQEAFFGDLNDKYLPTFQSLRLVVGVGATFLGAFVLCYGGLDLIRESSDRALDWVIGGHKVAFWSAVGPFLSLGWTLLFEPLRLALLAAAFRRTLTLLAERAGAATQGSGGSLVQPAAQAVPLGASGDPAVTP